MYGLDMCKVTTVRRRSFRCCYTSEALDVMLCTSNPSLEPKQKCICAVALSESARELVPVRPSAYNTIPIVECTPFWWAGLNSTTSFTSAILALSLLDNRLSIFLALSCLLNLVFTTSSSLPIQPSNILSNSSQSRGFNALSNLKRRREQHRHRQKTSTPLSSLFSQYIYMSTYWLGVYKNIIIDFKKSLLSLLPKKKSWKVVIHLPKEKISGLENVRFFWDLLKNHTMWHFDFTEVCGIHWTNPLGTIVIDTIFDRCTNTQVPIHSESIVLRFVSARPTRVHNLRSRIWVEVN